MDDSRDERSPSKKRDSRDSPAVKDPSFLWSRVYDRGGIFIVSSLKLSGKSEIPSEFKPKNEKITLHLEGSDEIY